MADITLSYNGNTIAEISESGTSTLNTSGTYCEDDITLEYVQPSGGSSGGLVKKTGTVSIASNYTYTGNVNETYTGLEIDTGLSNIYSVVAYSQNWKNGVWSSNMYGFSMAINNGIQTGDDNAGYPQTFYPNFAIIWNGQSRHYYNSAIQGVVLPMTANGLASGKFGIKTHAGSFPLLAGDTLVWEVVGEE